MWQTLIVIAIVAIALGLTIRRFYRTAVTRSAPSCGGCSACHLSADGLKPLEKTCERGET